MRLWLLPRYQAQDLPHVDPERLRSQGIRLLMLDFDNTIVPYTTSRPEPAVISFFDRAKKAGLTVCVVSNSKKSRVPEFCEKYGLPWIIRAKKPGSRGIREALRRFDAAPEEAALVGDQIFTDVLGANRNGVCSILIPAISNHNFWLKARHLLEMPFIFLTRRRRL